MTGARALRCLVLFLCVFLCVPHLVSAQCRGDLDCFGSDYCCAGNCCYRSDSCDLSTGQCYARSSSLAGGYIAMIVLLSIFACCICACLAMRRRRNGSWLYSSPYMTPNPNAAYINTQQAYPQQPPVQPHRYGFWSSLFGSRAQADPPGTDAPTHTQPPTAPSAPVSQAPFNPRADSSDARYPGQAHTLQQTPSTSALANNPTNDPPPPYTASV